MNQQKAVMTVRCFLALVFSVVMSTFAFSVSSAQAADAAVEAQLREAFEQGKLKGLHGVHVRFRGETFAEVFFPGKDQKWGDTTGVRQHGPDTLHDLRSVTKSIVALLYGIALSENQVPDPDKQLLKQFPEYEDLKGDPRRDAITIRDVLTMQMGTEWNEDLPYTDRRNSEIAMELAPDRYRYVLDRPMVSDPGTQWSYNGGATTILGRLIEKGSGKRIDQFAKEKLFAPLQITSFEWVGLSPDVPAAASGLRLNIRDLAKIGQLIASGGRYNGKQIIPKSWLNETVTPRTKTSFGLRYGYQWYLAPGDGLPGWVAGFGLGGQRLTVQPQHDLVFVFFAGNYNNREAWRVPVAAMQKILLPALKTKIGR